MDPAAVEPTLRRLAALIARGGPRPALGREVAESIRAAGDYGWVGLYDVTETEIVAVAWTGQAAPAFPRFPITRGLSGAAVAQRVPVVVQDVTRDPRYLTAFGSTRAEAIFPVLSTARDRVLGTLDVESPRPHAFTPDDESFLARCAEVIRPLWE